MRDDTNHIGVPQEAVLLRIFTSIGDKCGLDPLYHAIVKRAHEMKLAGATVLHGSVGFGQSAVLNEGRLFSLRNVPVIIEIVDRKEKIDAFLPVLDQMMESGLVTLENIKVMQYGREREGLIQRIREFFGSPYHPQRAKAASPATTNEPFRSFRLQLVYW